MLNDFTSEYQRYRLTAEKALAQLSDEALNRTDILDGNTPAMLVRHLSGNFRSRFTDFLTTDGEKSWRDRDEEFADRCYTREEVETMWRQGWDVLEQTLASLTDADLSRTVTIRGLPLTVHQALLRSLAHVAYHVGQLVLMARHGTDQSWQWISIPKGHSETYNRNPTLEKRPDGET